MFLKGQFKYIGIFLISLLYSASIFGKEIMLKNLYDQYASNGVVVGLLSTKNESYKGEYKTATQIIKVLETLGASVVLIDYNKVVNFKDVKSISLKRARGDKRKADLIESQLVYDAIKNFIQIHHINRIFIPGNRYNISSEPLPKTPYRQMVTNALVRFINNNPQIHLSAMCGGLQGIMAANGIRVVRLEKMLKSREAVKIHEISMPDPKKKEASLHKIMVIKGSRLASIISNYNNRYEDGWLFTYLPDAHSEAISNSKSNIIKLQNLGYKITGISEDGIIEAIEDKFGNIYLQSHPEYLAINAEQKYGKSAIKDRSILIAIDILRYFLYRK